MSVVCFERMINVFKRSVYVPCRSSVSVSTVETTSKKLKEPTLVSALSVPDSEICIDIFLLHTSDYTLLGNQHVL